MFIYFSMLKKYCDGGGNGAAMGLCRGWEK